MRPWIAGLLTGAVALGLVAGQGTASSAQEADRLDLDPIAVSAHPELSTILTAPAALGQETIEAGAVTVTEDGVAVPSRTERLADNRLEVVLVLDTSGSMRGEAFTSAKEAAGAFIARLPLEAKVALVSFGSQLRLASTLTDDRAALIAAIQRLTVGGKTTLYDAVELGTEQFSGDTGSRRSIVLLSDGADTESKASLASATAAVTASRARLDVVELKSDPAGHDGLVGLAGSGAGRIVAVDDPAALTGLYNTIAASLTNEYRLTWRSSSQGETRVVVRVEQDGVVAEAATDLDYSKAGTSAASPVDAPASASGWVLALGIVCAALALFIVGLFACAPRHRRNRSARLGVRRKKVLDSGALTGIVDRATGAAESALQRHGRQGRLNGRLEQAGVDLRPGEYIVVSVAAVVLAMVLGFALIGPVVAILLGVVTGVGSHLILSTLRTRRQHQFSDQLGDTLQHLAGALRAGHGLLQAIEALSREAEEPTGTEFRRLVVEARLGRDFSESLQAMSARIGTDDFDWVVQAIVIHREVGGDLSEVLDTIGATIRDRNQLYRQVKSLTAEGRLSAYILLALPLVLALALRLMNPDYFRLLTFGSGLMISGVSVVLMLLGCVWFRKLCKLQY